MRVPANRATRVGVATALVTAGALTISSVVSGAVSDYWSPLITIFSTSGLQATAIHSALLPNGTVLLMGKEEFSPEIPGGHQPPLTAVLTPTPLTQPPPASVTLSNISVPYDLPYSANVTTANGTLVFDSSFCGGGALTASGTLYSSGGTRFLINSQSGAEVLFGLPNGFEFSAATNEWTKDPNPMVGTGGLGTNFRWYPTTIRLGSQALLTIGGAEVVVAAPTHAIYANLSVELYQDGVRTLVSSNTQTPTDIFNRDYTHAFQMPNGRVLMIGESSNPVTMGLDGSWSVSRQTRPGTQVGETPNDGASDVLLPYRVTDGEWGYSNGSIATIGGELATVHEHSLDVYDPAQDAFTDYDLGIKRNYPLAVTLPDSRIAIVGGYASVPDNTGVVQYFDPRTRTVTTGSASMPEVRGYHNTGVLLPDGRILVVGGRNGTTALFVGETTTARYYYPDYMTAVRPFLAGLDAATFSLGHTYHALGFSATPTSEVVLVGLGSHTHSFDMNQRLVQVPINRVDFGDHSAQYVTFTLPSAPEVLPPGPYMLFVLDGNRVPSIAKIVTVQ